MFSKSAKQGKSIAEKVAACLTHPRGSDSDGTTEDETPIVEEFNENSYDDCHKSSRETTEFRKKTAKLLSEQSSRYKGKITSRKELDLDHEELNVHSDSDENLTSESDNNDNNENMNMNSDSEDNVNNEIATDSEDINESDEDSEADEDNGQQNVISRVDRETELQKGFCVKNQLYIWERLLELRIHSQKLLTKANRLPCNLLQSQQQQEHDEKKQQQGEQLQQLHHIPEQEKETSLYVMKLLQQLLKLQDALIEQNTELNNAITKSTNRKRSYPFIEDTTNDVDAITVPIKEIGDYLQERFDAFQPYRDSVLLKWDSRTRLLVPGAITKKPKKNEENYDILKKIQNVLINKRLLVKKSQQIKCNEQVQNENPESKQIKGSQERKENGENMESLPIESHNDLNKIDFNPEIYDDSDFYYEQLRELIEYKANSNTTNLHEVTKQFIELQKIRQKMKKKVDTRASKGRKLRYVVHKKLINFMAPNNTTTWTNDSKDELYRSLFA